MLKIKKMDLILKSLIIQNFKCFKKEQTIDFEKLTLLTGANSSGKSSIISAILGSLQSGEFPYRFSTNGKYVNMGDFREISNNHLSQNQIKIGITLQKVATKKENENIQFNCNTIWKNNDYNYLPDLYSLDITCAYFKYTLLKKRNCYIINFSYDPDKDPDATPENKKLYKKIFSDSFSVGSELRPKPKNQKEREKLKKEAEEFSEYVDTLYKKIIIKDFEISSLEGISKEIEKKKNFRLSRTVNSIHTLFHNYDDIINLISSFRSHPDRTYLEKSKNELKIDKFGEGYLDQILLWERRYPDRFKELISVMKKLKLIYSIKSSRIKGGRFELLISTQRGGTKTSLFDVGFGINQFLPIIVADLQLPKNSTLFVAQPEIHLHPDVQSKFGDYLVEQIKNKDKNYIIETHSEYLLNRIRLAIVKGQLKESDLSVYYLENTGKDVTVHKLKFGKQGQIENAPQSFFETYLMDLKDIALSVEL